MAGYSRGSRPVAFSGQTTRSGRGQAPGLDLRGQLQGGRGLVLGDLGVVQLLRQVPGPRHVALDRGHRGGRCPADRVDRQQTAREDQPGRHHRGQRRRRRSPGPPAAGRPVGPVRRSAASTAQAAMAPVSATRKLSSGAPPIATQRASGRRGLAHGQPAPGEGEGPPVPQGLGGHPPGRHRGRPAGQLEQQPLAQAQEGEDDRLGQGQRGPRVPGHVDQPGQQRHEQGHAEGQAAAERAPQAAPGQRDDQQPRPGRRQRPGADRRERGEQRQAARGAEQQRPARAEPAERPGAPGPRPGSERGLGDHDWQPNRPISVRHAGRSVTGITIEPGKPRRFA